MCYKNIVVSRRIFMSNDEKFEFDIANLKKDLAIENMCVNSEDIELLRRYYYKEISMTEMINLIKKPYIERA